MKVREVEKEGSQQRQRPHSDEKHGGERWHFTRERREKRYRWRRGWKDRQRLCHRWTLDPLEIPKIMPSSGKGLGGKAKKE